MTGMNSDPFDLADDSNTPFSPADADRGPVATPWLDGLNPEQLRAVTTTDGPLLVLSGAGTGKTRVLTARLTHIAGTHLARPWQIMAVTFTNRAAREMRERVSALLGPTADQVWLGTFHALCVKILRRHGEQIGLRSGFSILDTDDQQRVLKALMLEAGLDLKKWPVPMVMAILQRWKDRGWTPHDVPALEIGSLAGGAGKDLYRSYQARLMELNACDFGDLLLHVLSLFRSCPDIVQGYQQQFRYILVDEYQDTNVAQYLWLRLLAQGHGNICCVGDDDQSIYSWRGAEVGNILRFEQDFPGAMVVRLERNYRSTPVILGAASALIRHNSSRLGKDLYAAGSTERGEKTVVSAVWDGSAEARTVVSQVEDLRRHGESLSSMAILVRAGFQTREFEERLIATGTPYRMVGGLRFYERLEIRDILAYLRLICQPQDDLAFERIINTPKRGLGDAALQVVHRVARAGSLSLLDAARSVIGTDEMKPRPRAVLADFIARLDEWATLRLSLPPSELASMVLDGSGYMEMWKRDKTPEAPGRVENLQEFVRGLEDYEALEEFLEHVALVMENDSKAGTGESVTLMTLHAAKGLEFDTVFLPGWEEDVFPNRRALDDGGQQSLEEERRLAYVGLTRARRRVFISHASQRRIFRDWQQCLPSRFIGELPQECVEERSDTGAASMGYYRQSFSSRAGSGVSLSSRAASAKPAGGWSLGNRVFHQKFGPGTVLAVEGDKLEVAFDKAGVKRVLASFVNASSADDGGDVPF